MISLVCNFWHIEIHISGVIYCYLSTDSALLRFVHFAAPLTEAMNCCLVNVYYICQAVFLSSTHLIGTKLGVMACNITFGLQVQRVWKQIPREYCVYISGGTKFHNSSTEMICRYGLQSQNVAHLFYSSKQKPYI